MRLLFLINYYPPVYLGGNQESCREVAEGMSQRGHVVRVLTSDYRADAAPRAFNVYRQLSLEVDPRPLYGYLSFFWGRNSRRIRNIKILERHVAEFRPDAIVAWGMWNLHVSLIVHASDVLHVPVVHYLSDTSVTLPSAHVLHWTSPPRRKVFSGPKKVGVRFVTWIENNQANQIDWASSLVICISAALRNELVTAGIDVRKATIIHGGVDPGLFVSGAERGENPGELRLLYLGRLDPMKGVHLAIEAVAQAQRKLPGISLHLDIAGSGGDEYTAQLKKTATQLGIKDRVHFAGSVAREQVPDIMRAAHVLMLPTFLDAFPRVLLEGMAAGVAVTASDTGGVPEIIEDRRNGLLFPVGNVEALADRLILLAQHPELRATLAERGRQTIIRQFTLEKRTSRFEEYLANVIDQREQE